MSALWWVLPTLIMLGSIGWAYWSTRHDSTFGGMISLLARVFAALVLSLLAWIIGGVMK